jgi:hypothetical protein
VSGITNATAIRRLRALHDDGDPERAHREAELILLLLINDADVTLAFDGVPRWYA